MQNMTRRGSVYYVRFIVPKERWHDVGIATGARNGKRRDITKSLTTKDYREALVRRDAALTIIREETNAALAQQNLPPLHGDWKPSWGNIQQQLTEQALEARKALEEADTYRRPYYENDDPDTGHIVAEAISDRDFGADVVREELRATVQKIEAESTNKHEGRERAQAAYKQALGIAMGTATPLSVLLDRWFPQLEGHVTKELIDRHHRAFTRFGQYLADAQDLHTDNPEGYARSIPIERIDRKAAGHFREWLEKLPNVGPRVVGFHLSTMNTFWKWAQDVGYAEINPWEGSTRGLKKKIAKASRERGEKRPYTEAELIALLTQARERLQHPKKWPWARVIYDMLRLAPLTGCRQNELASLTVGRIIQPAQPGLLWRISITEEVSKTRSSTREVPLHPIAQEVIAQRLAELPAEHTLDTQLFPECKPGGRDDKPGHYLSKRYATFLRSALGEKPEIDFHSFRRCFSTFMTTAEANGAQHCSNLVLDHLIGHKPVSLAHNTYAAKRFNWSVYDKAIMEMVAKGVSDQLRTYMSST
ncbi:site-specific integrase [Acetobacter thailandicus]|uniref:tyrosine-type recombinase/integrase n=1 Tax=Acetobacter thailandicus TaxID=1502842 RepID=UPI001BADCBE3|nr:tyrosine-type recombinase/integrase [Acetobacter thailandicus]MBS0985769.1 tyrosine-type recombinase/integrase [Acetobacter thailandicus]